LGKNPSKLNATPLNSVHFASGFVHETWSKTHEIE